MACVAGGATQPPIEGKEDAPFSALIHPMARGLSKEPVMMNYPSWKGEGGDIPSLDVACQSVWKMGAVSWVQGLARPRGAVCRTGCPSPLFLRVV